MRSYFKFLSRNALYTAVEAVGLIFSITFVILIGNYVYEQWNVANENPNGKRVYAVGNKDYVALSWWDKEAFETKIPEVEAACRLSGPDNDLFATTDAGERIAASMTMADPEFFEIFPEYSLLEGDFQEYRIKGRCLVSESFARKLEGGNVLGTTLTVGSTFSTDTLIICGVFKDFINTLVPQTDILKNPAFSDWASLTPFSNIGAYTTFIKVADGTDMPHLQDKVNEVCRQNYSFWSDDFKENFPIYNVPELYFRTDQWVLRRGNLHVLRMLALVVLLLLLCAVFNYINLSLALSIRRSKEMATRRLLGASRAEIVSKYILESVFFTAVCFAAALLLAVALQPWMNNLLLSVMLSPEDAAYYIPLSVSWTGGACAVYLAAVLLLGVLSGVIPAMFASQAKPIDVVKGTFRRRSKMTFSKVFIVFQNAVSVVLIALAILMEVQLNHMADRPLNARSEGLYRLTFYVRNYSDVEPLVDRLCSLPQVKRVAYGANFPGSMNMSMGFNTVGDEGESYGATAKIILGTDEYFDLLGLHVVEDFAAPRIGSVWMSKSLADQIQLSDSTKEYYANKFNVNGAKSQYVGGVYEDIPTSAASASDTDLCSAFVIDKAEDILWANGLLIEVQGDEKEAESAVMGAYHDWSVEKNGTYEDCVHGYIKDIINAPLTPIRMSIRLVELFMALSVLISLLGLVAMSTYFSGENAKEVAIRKVFGSDATLETARLVRSYMQLCIFAIILGTPFAVWLSGRWLQRYAYRISGYWWVYVVSALLTLFIVFVSVIIQVRRSALTSPATELKKE